MITTGGCDDAYDLEPARQAREREAGLYLVLAYCWCNHFFPIVIHEFIIPPLYVAIFIK